MLQNILVKLDFCAGLSRFRDHYRPESTKVLKFPCSINISTDLEIFESGYLKFRDLILSHSNALFARTDGGLPLWFPLKGAEIYLAVNDDAVGRLCVVHIDQ